MARKQSGRAGTRKRDVSSRRRAEEALRESRATLEAIINSTSDIVFCVDTPSYTLLAFNRPFADYFREGRGLHIQPGMALDDIIPSELRPLWQGYFQRALTEGPFTVDYVTSIGRRQMHLNFRLLERDGEVFGISVFAKDMTDHDRAIAALRRSEERFRRAAQAAKFGTFEEDLVAGTSYWSPEASAILGLPPEVRPSRFDPAPDFVHLEDAGLVTETLRRAFDPAGDGSTAMEHRVVWPDGSTRWVQLKGQVQFAGDGTARRPARFIGTILDVTERREAEEALRRSEERFRVAARAARIGVFDLDLVGGTGYWSQETRPLLGLPAGAPLPRPGTVPAYVHREDVERVAEAVRRALDPAGDGSTGMEHRVLRPDGSVHWIQWRGQVQFAGEGGERHAVRASGTIVDITELKQAEEALQQRNRYIETLLEKAPIGFAVRTIDDGIARFVSARYEEILGCPRGSIVSHDTFFDTVWPRDPELRERIRVRVQADLASGEASRMRWESVPVPLATGETRYVTVVAIPLLDQNLLVFTVQDVTDRVRAEQRLSESELRFRQVAESVTDFIWEVDAEGLYTYTSPSVEKILGYTPEDLQGKVHFYDLFAPEAREELKAAAFEVFGARQAFRAFAAANRSKNGEIVHLETSGVPLLGPAGDLQGYRGASTDVTVRKRAEEWLRMTFQEVEEQKERLQAERDYLEKRITISHTLGVVGQSRSIQKVLTQVKHVAPTEASVLITGETGTGKELIAHAIHHLSPRGERTMVIVNCAALPAPLIESELFGHEQGAYTGAVTTRVGRFELADGSTLFLDEVAELPLELQAKLLRVLDKGQFERLGSTRHRRADVRLIAATNRDLSREVREGSFRKDLFYRLNVFPVHVPPLRERREDIPLLVWQFAGYFGQQSGKLIDTIPRETMERLQEQPWPGNVRELRNVIERAVILSSGGALSVSLPSSPDGSGGLGPLKPLTLDEVERRHIREVLAHTRGRIGGPGGAAALLGVNRTTLQSMLKRLGIDRKDRG